MTTTPSLLNKAVAVAMYGENNYHIVHRIADAPGNSQRVFLALMEDALRNDTLITTISDLLSKLDNEKLPRLVLVVDEPGQATAINRAQFAKMRDMEGSTFFIFDTRMTMDSEDANSDHVHYHWMLPNGVDQYYDGFSTSFHNYLQNMVSTYDPTEEDPRSKAVKLGNGA